MSVNALFSSVVAEIQWRRSQSPTPFPSDGTSIADRNVRGPVVPLSVVIVRTFLYWHRHCPFPENSADLRLPLPYVLWDSSHIALVVRAQRVIGGEIPRSMHVLVVEMAAQNKIRPCCPLRGDSYAGVQPGRLLGLP